MGRLGGWPCSLVFNGMLRWDRCWPKALHAYRCLGGNRTPNALSLHALTCRYKGASSTERTRSPDFVVTLGCIQAPGPSFRLKVLPVQEYLIRAGILACKNQLCRALWDLIPFDCCTRSEVPTWCHKTWSKFYSGTMKLLLSVFCLVHFCLGI